MNQVQISGYLGKDPEIRFTQSGKAVAAFSVGVGRGKDQNGESKGTDWINCVAWDKDAEAVGNNTGKGTYVGVIGRLQVRSYEDKNGQKRWTTEVIARQVFLGLFKDGPASGSDKPPSSFDGMGETVKDEEIPF
jgi:single-strand DNA-binding protein